MFVCCNNLIYLNLCFFLFLISSPGSVTTRYGRSVGMPETILADLEDQIKERTILKFVPQPIEIAKLAMFLASDDARNITGSIIVTDGGSLLMKPY